MYCVRVAPGTEKRQVNRITEGFLPMYRTVNEYGRHGQHPVVPGYVFTPNYAPGMVQVPENEWKLIEAISDPEPSVLDHANRMITEGPLKAVEADITEIESERINICVRLLGENRPYWLIITPFDSETADTYRKPIPEEPENDVKAGKKPARGRVKVEFTEVQRAAMIARSEEVGTRQAAKEYSVPWQVIAGMKRKARAGKGGEEVAEEKKVDPGKKPGRRKKATVEAAGASGLLPVPEDAETLFIQNAVLRERAETLESQVARLKKALQELL